MTDVGHPMVNLINFCILAKHVKAFKEFVQIRNVSIAIMCGNIIIIPISLKLPFANHSISVITAFAQNFTILIIISTKKRRLLLFRFHSSSVLTLILSKRCPVKNNVIIFSIQIHMIKVSVCFTILRRTIAGLHFKNMIIQNAHQLTKKDASILIVPIPTIKQSSFTTLKGINQNFVKNIIFLENRRRIQMISHLLNPYVLLISSARLLTMTVK